MQMCYLARNKIHVAEIAPPHFQGAETSQWQLSPGQQDPDFAGLSCIGSSGVLMHRTPRKIVSGEPKAAAHIVRGNIRAKTLEQIDSPNDTTLLFPIASPDHSRLAAVSLGRKGMSGLAILPASGGVPRIYSDMSLGNPQSWSRDGRYVYLTSLRGRNDVRKTRFDTLRESFEDLGPGRMPTPSPSGRYLAYIDGDRSKLYIEESNSQTVQTLNGFFQGIGSWIGEDRILVVTATGLYQDSIAVAEIATKKLIPIRLNYSGEIQGACILES